MKIEHSEVGTPPATVSTAAACQGASLAPLVALDVLTLGDVAVCGRLCKPGEERGMRTRREEEKKYYLFSFLGRGGAGNQLLRCKIFKDKIQIKCGTRKYKE